MDSFLGQLRISLKHEKLYEYYVKLSDGPGHAKICLMPYANNKGAISLRIHTV